MNPALLQAKLTPTGTLTALVQAPVVLTYLDGLGVKVSDSVAKADAQKRGIADPADSTLEIIKLATAISLAQSDGKLTDADAQALTQQLQALNDRRQPALRHVQPADRVGRAHARPAGSSPHNRRRSDRRPARAGRHVAPRRARPALARRLGGRRRRHGAPGPQPRRAARGGGRRARASPSRRSVTPPRRRWPGAWSTSPPPSRSSGSARPTATRGCPTPWPPRCRGSRCPRTSRWSSGRGTCRAAGCSTSSPPWTGCARPAAAPGTPSRPTRAWRRTSSRRPTRCCTPSRAATARHLAEELGDVLLQVVFHARVAEEAGARRPSTSTPSPGCSSTSWCAATRTSSPTATPRRRPRSSRRGSGSRRQEKEADADGGGGYAADLLHGIPASLPGDLAAEKVLARVRRRDLTPTPDAVARLEQARAALAAAEVEVRAALADLAASIAAPPPPNPPTPSDARRRRASPRRDWRSTP